MKLIELNPRGSIVFVGDTHGDVFTTRKIVDEYLKPNVKMCFLGDYVDRGLYSRENIEFLLGLKKQHPRKVYLLQGNHEGKMISDVCPSSFWDRLSYDERQRYNLVFRKFPLALGVGEIIAVHGALPDITKLRDFNKIEDGDNQWYDTVWADFLEAGSVGPRKFFGEDYFEKVMKRIGKSLLIRSHDPDAPTSMYDGRCVTLFTSSVYRGDKTIAIADFNRNRIIESAADLEIKVIN